MTKLISPDNGNTLKTNRMETITSKESKLNDQSSTVINADIPAYFGGNSNLPNDGAKADMNAMILKQILQNRNNSTAENTN